MTKTAKQLSKKIIAMAFVALFIISSFSTRAFAAGEETWSSAYKQEPKMTITNNNLTKIKTMGSGGTLHIVVSVKGRPDLEPANCPKVKLTVQIRKTNGQVIRETTVREDAFMPQVNLDLPVNAGEQYQIFFDISSVSYNPNGNYRKADVTYSHEIY